MPTTKKQTPLLPVYLVVGEDALKRSTVLARLRARLAQYGDMSFNSDTFDGEEALGGDIVAACNTLPFASDVRLVYVRNADKLKKADSEELVAYVKSPSEQTVLALEAEKLAKNTRLYKAVAGVGKSAVIDCAPLKRYELPKTVRSMATSRGVVFTEGAASCLVDLIGENTVHLNAEIEKIALAHKGSDPVTEHEVRSLVSRVSEAKPWDLTDALSERNLKKCLDVLNRMPSASPLVLIGMCTTRIRELICARSMLDRGTSQALAKELSAISKKAVPDWRVKNHTRWTRAWSAPELHRALISARDAERAMKSGSDPEDVFMRWVISACTGR